MDAVKSIFQAPELALRCVTEEEASPALFQVRLQPRVYLTHIPSPVEGQAAECLFSQSLESSGFMPAQTGLCHSDSDSTSLVTSALVRGPPEMLPQGLYNTASSH